MTEPCPEPPNVRVEFTDGREAIPLELRYDGIDDDGLHRWTTTMPVTILGGATPSATLRDWQVHPEVMPRRASVVVHIDAIADDGSMIQEVWWLRPRHRSE